MMTIVTTPTLQELVHNSTGNSISDPFDSRSDNHWISFIYIFDISSLVSQKKTFKFYGKLEKSRVKRD